MRSVTRDDDVPAVELLRQLASDETSIYEILFARVSKAVASGAEEFVAARPAACIRAQHGHAVQFAGVASGVIALAAALGSPGSVSHATPGMATMRQPRPSRRHTIT
jgi:hypothetical protein